MATYLGVDIGTYEAKGVIADGDGRILARAATPHRMIVPQPGWAEHRAEQDWWGDFKRVVKMLLAAAEVDSRSIRAVGCSGIGPCMLPVDAAGEPLMNAVLYGVDARAAAEVDELNAQLGSATLVTHCGATLTSQSVGPKILWLRRHRPEIFARTHKILNSNSFLVHRLTGRYVIDHYSAACFAPLYALERNQWDTSLADIADRALLPDLAWSTDVVGTVTPEAAAETGLAAGTPVIAGTIDAAAEAVSVGVGAPGEAMIMYGSTTFMIVLSEQRVMDRRLEFAPWVFEGTHAAMSGQATSGTVTHWFRDQLSRDLPAEQALAALGCEASGSPPGANGIVFLPYFSGERTPLHDPKAKGMFFGLDLTHNRGDLLRAVYEGIACGVRHTVETYRDSGLALDRVVAVGGGTKSDVWRQSVSDIVGISQELPAETIGASYGDAFLAAVGVGAARSTDIRQWNQITSQTVPNAANEPLFSRRYEIFRALYDRTSDLMHRLHDDH